MPFAGSGLRPAKPIPTFRSGWALGPASVRPDLWRGLTLAWAPFLGIGSDPSRWVFGSAGSRDVLTTSGSSASAPNGFGNSWNHLDGTGAFETMGKVDDFAPNLSQITIAIGMRKTDATFRGGAIGASGPGVSNLCGVLCPFADGTTIWDYGGVSSGSSRVVVNTGGHTWQLEHVMVFTAGPQGMWVYCDGEPIGGFSTAPAARAASSSNNFILGTGAELGNNGDIAEFNFLYIWDYQLPIQAVSEISADPWALFRPRTPVVKGPAAATFVDLAANLAGVGDTAATLGLIESLSAGLSGAGAVSASLAAVIELSTGIVGAGALTGNLGIFKALNAGLVGSGSVIADLTKSTTTLATAIAGVGTVTADLSGSPSALTGGSGGLGAEPLGDPLGSGGPVHAVRARAVEGQTVRVVFDAEPLHQGSAGTNDALNPSNYEFAITGGTGTGPLAVGVKTAVVPGPAAGVETGQWGVDVQTDRQLIVGLTYQVTVAARVVSKAGGTLGAPFSVPFVGVVRLLVNLPPPRQLANLDLGFNSVTGTYIVGDSGDVDPQGGLDGLRKRIFRRYATPKNSYAHLPGYGLLPKLQSPASIREILALKADAVQQIGAEPEVASVDIQVSFSDNVLTISTSVKTRTGLVLQLTTAFDAQSGGIVLS